MSQSLDLLEEKKPWYSNGLNFKCTECGKCCTGVPGYAWVTEEEICAIAEYLKLTVDDFFSRFIRRVDGRFSLIEMPKNYDCVFLRDKRCTIYPVRPKQCRTFPWWPHTLESEEQWLETAKYCEGINPNAPLVAYTTIKRELKIQTDN